MKIEIKGPWHEHEAHADEDRKFFKFLFGLEQYGTGKRTVQLTESKEYAATATIELDDYEIEKKIATRPEVATY